MSIADSFDFRGGFAPDILEKVGISTDDAPPPHPALRRDSHECFMASRPAPEDVAAGGLSRRALFRPRRAVPERPRATEEGPSYDLVNVSRPSMGSYFEIKLPANTPAAVDLASRALDRVEELESRLTVYRDDSEISRLNATAHLGFVPLEEKLFGLLSRAVEIHRETAGAYDVASGALSLAWGFTKGPRRVPGPAELEAARSRTGSRFLILDPETRSIRFEREGVVLNLGGIGKGFAIDEATAILRDHWWPTSALIHGGRSSLYALGSPLLGRWEIALRNPYAPETPIGVARLRNRAMGTSGASFQQFEENGRVYGHIIDPRTGEPPETGPGSVSVFAPTAAEADALSTAFYLLGPEAADHYHRGRPDVGFLFVFEGETPARPRIEAIGLSKTDFVPSSSGSFQ